VSDPLQAIQWLSQTGELDRLCNEVLAPAIAEALAASRIAELERELAEARKLAGTLDGLHAQGQHAYDALAAHAAVLRDALERAATCENENDWSLCAECRRAANEALAATPAQSLAALRDRVLDEAAQAVADRFGADSYADDNRPCPTCCDYNAAAIRALKSGRAK